MNNLLLLNSDCFAFNCFRAARESEGVLDVRTVSLIFGAASNGDQSVVFGSWL
jgi:hypothetical protein